jgi:hypothetical protein
MAVYLHALSLRHVDATFDEPPVAKATYTLEITPSYQVGTNDPFAPNFDDTQQPSLVVRLAGTEIFATTDTLAAGKPIRIEALTGLKTGENRLLVSATVSEAQSTRAHAIRMVVFRDAVKQVDETIWSGSGGTVSDEIVIHVAESDQPERPHDHD